MRQVKDALTRAPPLVCLCRGVTTKTHDVHRTDTFRWWAYVVDVHGSKTLLERLDREVLASAAALTVRAPVAPSRPAG
jgi:hypothetical protein